MQRQIHVTCVPATAPSGPASFDSKLDLPGPCKSDPPIQNRQKSVNCLSKVPPNFARLLIKLAKFHPTFVEILTIRHLDRKGEIDHADFNENWALAERLVKRIRPALADVILANPQLPDEEIKRQVERLVDRHIDGCLDSVPAGA